MTPTISNAFDATSYDPSKDVVLTYFPDSCYEATRKTMAKGFLKECFKHLTNREDRNTLEEAMRAFGYRNPVRVTITPYGSLRGNSIRMVNLGEEEKKYRVLDRMHGICIEYEDVLTSANIPHPDFRKLFARQPLHKIEELEKNFCQSLRGCVKSLYKHGIIANTEIAIQASPSGVVAVLVDRLAEEVLANGEVPLAMSKYRELLSKLQ